MCVLRISPSQSVKSWKLEVHYKCKTVICTWLLQVKYRPERGMRKTFLASDMESCWLYIYKITQIGKNLRKFLVQLSAKAGLAVIQDQNTHHFLDAFEGIQQWRLHTVTGKPVPVFEFLISGWTLSSFWLFLWSCVLLPYPTVKCLTLRSRKCYIAKRRSVMLSCCILAKRPKDIFCFLVVYTHFEIAFSGLRREAIIHKYKQNFCTKAVLLGGLYILFFSSQKRSCSLSRARNVKT